MEDKDEIYRRAFKDVLAMRGINIDGGDEPCKSCSGLGYKAYGNTSTWRGGIGGCMVTGDVCDKCWGSGNAEKPWVNLRRLPKECFQNGR